VTLPAATPSLPPPDERRRLAELADLDILGSPPEAAFDRITRELARIFGVRVSSIAFADDHRLVYKARVQPGDPPPPAEAVPLQSSICAQVVGHNAPLIVDDLAADPRFADSPVVTRYGMRFYAGAPLRSDSGLAVGSFCIADDRPRHLTDRERGLLALVASSIMTEVKLRAASARLARRNAAVELDLDRARAVQRFLLPPAAQHCGPFRVSHLYRPHAQLGGDFVDVVVRPADGTAVVLVADVSGHGAGAALTAAMTKAAFVRRAPAADGPGDLLAALNADLVDASPAAQFMTAVAAVLDPRHCAVRLSSAGHPLPLLIRAGAASPVGDQSAARDIPLLIEPAQRYASGPDLPLGPGDRLLFYTDGATEAADADGDMLGDAGLARLASASAPGPGAEWLAPLLDAIADHAAPGLRDDVALVGVEVGA
jgi:serine phosphatase RsbU (regulator of sigma subunit)